MFELLKPTSSYLLVIESGNKNPVVYYIIYSCYSKIAIGGDVDKSDVISLVRKNRNLRWVMSLRYKLSISKVKIFINIQVKIYLLKSRKMEILQTCIVTVIFLKTFRNFISL